MLQNTGSIRNRLLAKQQKWPALWRAFLFVNTIPAELFQPLCYFLKYRRPSVKRRRLPARNLHHKFNIPRLSFIDGGLKFKYQKTNNLCCYAGNAFGRDMVLFLNTAADGPQKISL